MMFFSKMSILNLVNANLGLDQDLHLCRISSLLKNKQHGEELA